jgi:exopolysaccharide biosynthesis protein
MLILVADGRQPFYSEGVTLAELAAIMAIMANTALNLDGAGPPPWQSPDGSVFANVLNSPVDRNIPGLQRPVGNHLGLWVKEP